MWPIDLKDGTSSVEASLTTAWGIQQDCGTSIEESRLERSSLSLSFAYTEYHVVEPSRSVSQPSASPSNCDGWKLIPFTESRTPPHHGLKRSRRPFRTGLNQFEQLVSPGYTALCHSGNGPLSYKSTDTRRLSVYPIRVYPKSLHTTSPTSLTKGVQHGSWVCTTHSNSLSWLIWPPPYENVVKIISYDASLETASEGYKSDVLSTSGGQWTTALSCRHFELNLRCWRDREEILSNASDSVSGLISLLTPESIR